MEYLINQKEQEQIQKAIESFESKSSAEIVTVIAKRSDSYLFIPTLWAAVGALFLPLVIIGIFDNIDKQEFNFIQLAVFIILAILGQIKFVKMLLIPSFVKKKRSSNLAQKKFFEVLSQDTQRDGLVMLFVSEEEKYVEILTDSVIAQKVDNALWNEAIENFIAHVKEGNIAQGYLETIEKASKLLIELFPETKEDKDGLPDHLIMI